MAQYKSEYSRPSVACDSGCGYNSLGCYYGERSVMPALRAGTTKNVFVVPQYSAIGYDALTHGQSGSCQQYFNIMSAYGKDAGSCQTRYSTRLCSPGQCGQHHHKVPHHSPYPHKK